MGVQELLHPRPDEPSSSKQPHLPSELFQFSSEENVLELAKEVQTLMNTHNWTKWAHKMFELWKQARKMYHSEVSFLEDLLVTRDPVLLNTYLNGAIDTRQLLVEMQLLEGSIYYEP